MENRTPNALINEKSPYLLQHAYNPVQWRPWGEAAFEEARSLDRPIFLSIGYATCHWCHVMEHDSFEDDAVAALLNEHFIPIKVDREERPDVDHIYMTVCQMTTGSGGWPLSIFLTPEREAFFAATFIPKEDRFNRTGMLGLLPQISTVWHEDRKRLTDSAGKITDAIRNANAGQTGAAAPGPDVLDIGFTALDSRFDRQYGGFGDAPKFPTPHNLLFLLRHWQAKRDSGGLNIVDHTLSQMRLGGIYDQVGFGFHRYATDREWLLPHFEKMLYDQALLTLAYLECYQANGDVRHADTAREVLRYVDRDLGAPEGGFYSAEDADSEGEEGLFYVWTDEEVRGLLGRSADTFLKRYNCDAQGNFLDEATHQYTGRNIPHLLKPIEADESEALQAARDALFERRKTRIRPLLDDKVLTDWNGLMIAAFARAGATLGEPGYIDRARAAAAFIKRELRTSDGSLLHRYRDGEAVVVGNLDDYAYLAWGLLEIYDACGTTEHLADALRLVEIVVERFSDEIDSFWFTANNAETLIARARTYYDGACPSGNAVMAYVLMRLSAYTGDDGHAARAEGVLAANGTAIEAQPMGHAMSLVALDWAHRGGTEVVLCGSNEDCAALRAVLREHYDPRRVIVEKTPDTAEALAKLAPYTANYPLPESGATAYVCHGHQCKAPVDSPDALRALLGTA